MTLAYRCLNIQEGEWHAWDSMKWIGMVFGMTYM